MKTEIKNQTTAPAGKTVLFDLPDYEVDNSGSDLSRLVKSAGYDVSPRHVINSWNAWHLTVEDFMSRCVD